MIYRGTVKHGVIEIENGRTLPDGTQVRIEPLTAHDANSEPKAIGWPPNYFESTFGAIADDTFERPAQGELPEAVDLE